MSSALRVPCRPQRSTQQLRTAPQHRWGASAAVTTAPAGDAAVFERSDARTPASVSRPVVEHFGKAGWKADGAALHTAVELLGSDFSPQAAGLEAACRGGGSDGLPLSSTVPVRMRRARSSPCSGSDVNTAPLRPY